MKKQKPVRLAVPYRPWDKEKIEPYVRNLAYGLTNDYMMAGLLGRSFGVVVHFDERRKRIAFLFRSAAEFED